MAEGQLARFNAMPGNRVGRYQILAPLASGGMGAVYIGCAEGLGGFSRLVAIKRLHQELSDDTQSIKNFFDEARLAARIDHPNVISTHDIFRDPEWGYLIVMDYVHGHHVGILMRNRPLHDPLPMPVCLRVVTDALAGLSAAHNLTDADGHPLNLIHRDVTPHNILVGVNGNVRLTDFGVARAAVRLSSATQGNEFKGKVAYGAPEYLSGKMVDQRADIFSMGVVLWEILTGERLFSADSRLEQLGKILYDEIPAPSKYRPELAPLDEVVQKALCRDVVKRFQTAEEFRDALLIVAPGVGGLASNSAIGRLVRHTETDVLKAREACIREGERKTRYEDSTVTLSDNGDSSRQRLKLESDSQSGSNADTGPSLKDSGRLKQLAAAYPQNQLITGITGINDAQMAQGRHTDQRLWVFAFGIIGILAIVFLLLRDARQGSPPRHPQDINKQAVPSIAPTANTVSPKKTTEPIAPSKTPEAPSVRDDDRSESQNSATPSRKPSSRKVHLGKKASRTTAQDRPPNAPLVQPMDDKANKRDPELLLDNPYRR